MRKFKNVIITSMVLLILAQLVLVVDIPGIIFQKKVFAEDTPPTPTVMATNTQTATATATAANTPTPTATCTPTPNYTPTPVSYALAEVNQFSDSVNISDYKSAGLQYFSQNLNIGNYKIYVMQHPTSINKLIVKLVCDGSIGSYETSLSEKSGRVSEQYIKINGVIAQYSSNQVESDKVKYGNIYLYITDHIIKYSYTSSKPLVMEIPKQADNNISVEMGATAHCNLFSPDLTASYQKSFPLNFSPYINVIYPAQNSIYSEQDSISLPSICVSDKNNDTLTCRYYLDSEKVARDEQVVTGTSSVSTVTFSNGLSSGSISQGSHKIRFEVSDGKEKATKSVFIKIDKSSSAITKFNVASTNTSIYVSGTARDSIAGLDITPYRFTVGDQTSSWHTDCSYTQAALVPNTKYLIKLEAKDKKAHIAEIHKYYYTKAQAPTISASSSTVNTISLSVTDNNPATTKYQILVNDKYVNQTGALSTAPSWITLTNKQIIITGLTANTSYGIGIRARNEAGIGTDLSSITNVTTL